MKKVKLTESQLVELIEYSVKKMSVKESINEKYKTWDINFDGRIIRKNFRDEMDENSVKMWCERYFEKTPKMVSGVSENINEQPEILEPDIENPYIENPDIENPDTKRIDPRRKPFTKPEHIEPDSEPTPAKALIENKIKLSKSELEKQGIKYNPDCKYYKKGDFIYKVRNDGNYTCYKDGKVHNLGKNFSKEVVDESLKGLALGGAMLANTLTSGTENPNVLKGGNVEMYSQNFKPLNKNMNIKGEPKLSLISKPLKTISDGIEFNNNNAKKKISDLEKNIKNINHSFIEKDGSFIIKSEYYIDDTVEYGIGVNESNSKHSLEADLKIYQSELNMLNKIKPTGEKYLKRKEDLKKKISDLEKKISDLEKN